jgi:hypothetical protein
MQNSQISSSSFPSLSYAGYTTFTANLAVQQPSGNDSPQQAIANNLAPNTDQTAAIANSTAQSVLAASPPATETQDAPKAASFANNIAQLNLSIMSVASPADKDKEIALLRGEILNLRSDCARDRAVHTATKAKIAELEKDVSALRQKNQELELENPLIKQNNETLRAEKETLLSNITHLRGMIEYNEQQSQRMLQELIDVKGQLDAAAIATGTSEDEKNTALNTVAKLEEMVKKMQKSIEDKNGEIFALRMNNEEVSQANRIYSQQYAQLQQKMAQLKRTLEQVRAAAGRAPGYDPSASPLSSGYRK